MSEEVVESYEGETDVIINNASIGESIIWLIQTTDILYLAYNCILYIAYYTGLVV